MAANSSEQFGLEESSDIWNASFKIFESDESNETVRNHLQNASDFGFVNIFDPSTSDTIQFVFVGILLTTVAVLGIIGNILSILVLSQKKIHASLTVLLIGLSLCDLFVCILLMALKGLPSLFKYLHFGSMYLGWICHPKKYIFPILQTVQLGSTYFTVAITFERFIAVCRPLQSRSISTYQKAKHLSFCIAIFSFASNSLMFYSYAKRIEIFHEGNLTCQSISPNIPQFIGHLRLIIYVVIHYLIPLITVIVANIIIVTKIHAKNKRRHSITTQSQLKEVKLTNMLVVVVVTYIICNLFRVINAVTNNIFNTTYAEFVALTDFLVVFNSAVNYLIYCAYGQSFRDSFVKMFCHCDWSRGPGLERGRSEFGTETVVTEMSAIQSIRRFSKDVMNAFGRSQKYDVRDLEPANKLSN